MTTPIIIRVGQVSIALAAVAIGLVFTPPAEATSHCDDRAALLEQLQEDFDESPHAIGLGLDGNIIEILVSPAGTWTILSTSPRGLTCIVAGGTNWEFLLSTIGSPA